MIPLTAIPILKCMSEPRMRGDDPYWSTIQEDLMR